MVIKKLVEKKIFATINQKPRHQDGRRLGAPISARPPTRSASKRKSTQEIQLAEDTADRVRSRARGNLMGHVDLARPRCWTPSVDQRSRPRSRWHPTQHIVRTWSEKNGHKISFIDTPGHEALLVCVPAAAKVTDIVGWWWLPTMGFMPQTLEAIDHAKAAGVTIIVAINKIDKGDAQPGRIKQQLAIEFVGGGLGRRPPLWCRFGQSQNCNIISSIDRVLQFWLWPKPAP